MAYEAKQYAQRNRQGSDWFSHDGGPGAVKPVSPVPAEPVAAAIEEPAAADENNVDKSPTEEAAAAPATPPAPGPVSARAQMIKPKCDSNEWFVLINCLCCAAQLLGTD